MIEMMVGLFWQKEKLVSASFGETQFWTQIWLINLVDQNDANGADLLDLRVS